MSNTKHVSVCFSTKKHEDLEKILRFSRTLAGTEIEVGILDECSHGEIEFSTVIDGEIINRWSVGGENQEDEEEN